MIPQMNTTVDAANFLKQVAAMSANAGKGVASGAGRGYVGVVGGHVVKLATHIAERRNMDATKAAAVGSACSDLKDGILAAVEKLLGKDGKQKIRDFLERQAGKQGGLLTRRIALDAVKEVKAQLNERVTTAKDQFKALQKEGCPVASEVSKAKHEGTVNEFLATHPATKEHYFKTEVAYNVAKEALENADALNLSPIVGNRSIKSSDLESVQKALETANEEKAKFKENLSDLLDILLPGEDMLARREAILDRADKLLLYRNGSLTALPIYADPSSRYFPAKTTSNRIALLRELAKGTESEDARFFTTIEILRLSCGDDFEELQRSALSAALMK